MKFKLKDPGSSITHFIGMLMALFAATPLLIRASTNPDKLHVVSLAIFILSMILLYGASATYHALDLSENTNRFLRKLDHMMIFVLIAGTYTPVCIIVLGGTVGYAGMGHRPCRDSCKSFLDYLPKMVFFYIIYCNGLGMRTGIYTDYQLLVRPGICMAPCRRHYLYHRRHYLRFEAAHFQFQA